MTRVLHRAIHAVPVRVSGRHRDGRPVRRERHISDMQRDSQACTGPCVLWTMTRLEWNTCSGPSFLGVRVIYRHGLRVAPLDGACWNCDVVRRPGNRARGSTRPARAARSKMAIILDERAAAADSFDDNVIRQRQSDVCCCSAGRLPSRRSTPAASPLHLLQRALRRRRPRLSTLSSFKQTPARQPQRLPCGSTGKIAGAASLSLQLDALYRQRPRPVGTFRTLRPGTGRQPCSLPHPTSPMHPLPPPRSLEAFPGTVRLAGHAAQ